MGDRDVMKRAAARAAVTRVVPGQVLGVGSGTTVAFFIDSLAELSAASRPSAAVATSSETRRRLERIGIAVIPLERARAIPVYVDGADELDHLGRMLKGGGGALTAEKAVASASATFVCIVDELKLVARLGESSPVTLEVEPAQIPVARAVVEQLGGRLSVRDATSEAGNALADASGLDLADPDALEAVFDLTPGVVGCGVFAKRRADVVLIGRADGTVREYRPGRDAWD